MNILINFDFMCAVKNVNENFSLKKITRNKKSEWAKINLPLFLGTDLLLLKGDIKRVIAMLISQFGICYVINLFPLLVLKTDIFKNISENDLKDLVIKIQNSGFDTSYELLKQSKQYDKKYEIKINEKKIPQIVQSKYIIVHAYDYTGDVKKVSVVQEHVMGSKEYVLSLGSPKKVYKPVFSNA